MNDHFSFLLSSYFVKLLVRSVKLDAERISAGQEAKLTTEEGGYLGLPLNLAGDTRYTQLMMNLQGKHSIKEIVERFDVDERFEPLKGKVLSRGWGGTGFQSHTGALWWMWYANIHGVESADKCLDRFLSEEQVECWCVTWLLGVEASQDFKLSENVILTTPKSLPINRELVAIAETMVNSPLTWPYPEAVLVTKLLTPKISQPLHSDPAGFQVSRDHNDIALLLNLVPGICSSACLHTSHVAESIPPSVWGSGGWSQPLSDVVVSRRTRFSDAGRITDFFNALQRKTEEKEVDRLRRSLQRLALAKGREYSPSNQLLDLCISLEMLLLSEISEKDQLALSFRLRGSWLIGERLKDRKEIYGVLKDLYNLRSQVVHGGRLKGKEYGRDLSSYFDVAERIIAELVLRPAPNWEDMILGEIQ